MSPRKTLLFFALSLITPFAWATQTWVGLAASSNGEYKSYLDTDSYEQMGEGNWAVWIKITYSGNKRDNLFGPTYKIDLRRALVNCRARQWATIQRTRQDESGNPVSQEQWPESKWVFSAVGPKGGTNHLEHESICSLALLPLKRLVFDRSGNWQKITESHSIDISSSLRADQWLYYRSLGTEPEQRRVNDKKLVATISYTAHNCKEKTFAIYSLANLGDNEEILRSFVVTPENVNFIPVNEGSMASIIQAQFCPSQNFTREQGPIDSESPKGK